MKKCKQLLIFNIGILLIAFGCKTQNSHQDIMQILNDFPDSQKSFINKKYHNTPPLAQIINLPVHSDSSQSFYLDKDQDLQVYGVGEILFNLSDEEKRYYLANDDIELFFELKNDSTKSPSAHSSIKSYIFNYRDTTKFEERGISFKEIDEEKLPYTAEISIPWKELGVTNPSKDLKLRFDIGIGDNDDGLLQETKLSWNSKADVMNVTSNTYGEISLSASRTSPMSSHLLHSVYTTPSTGEQRDKLWFKIPSYQIKNVVYGFTKDKFDLSATVKSTWDEQNIYFLFEINDSRRKFITKKKVKERQIFIDYGWIEDEKGKIVWEMHAKNSTAAGGAFKNQKVDTVLHLKAGKYAVRYTSDESHAYNDWNDDPPEIPFYGIVLYKKL